LDPEVRCCGDGRGSGGGGGSQLAPEHGVSGGRGRCRRPGEPVSLTYGVGSWSRGGGGWPAPPAADPPPGCNGGGCQGDERRQMHGQSTADGDKRLRREEGLAAGVIRPQLVVPVTGGWYGTVLRHSEVTALSLLLKGCPLRGSSRTRILRRLLAKPLTAQPPLPDSATQSWDASPCWSLYNIYPASVGPRTALRPEFVLKTRAMP
jgi:hypothetical protein